MIRFVHGTLQDAGVRTRASGVSAWAWRLCPARLDGGRRVVLPSVGDGGSAHALVPVGVVTARGTLRRRAWIAPGWRADRLRPRP